MIDLNDIDVIEGCEPVESEENYYAALQRAINGGSAWSLQGSCGRAMMGAIEDGYCMLGKAGARDAYGNVIPSRDDIKPGFPGSYDFVAACNGADYADMLAAL